MHRGPHILCLFLAAIAAAGEPPITLSQLSRKTADGPVEVFVAQVNLADPLIEVVVTEPLPGTLAADGDGTTTHEAVLTPTDQWAKDNKLELAVNANFFGRLGKDPEADIIGLSISDGRVISPLRSFEKNADPALVFAKDNTARIACIDEAQLPGAWDAVAGVGASEKTPRLGGLLVQDGKNLGEKARVEPMVRHPRTGAGVSADGRTLWLVVVDGRQAGYSVGMTLPELADLLIELGADDAVALDGGGSSAFVAKKNESEWITNKPSDGKFRPVANSLGFRLREPEKQDSSPAASSDAVVK
ncbi:MAG: phosphodiester glycosidase family protein [Phycisphaerales bacterium]